MTSDIDRHLHFVDLQKTIVDSTATVLTWNGKDPEGVKPHGDDIPPGILYDMLDPTLVCLGHVNRTE